MCAFAALAGLALAVLMAISAIQAVMAAGSLIWKVIEIGFDSGASLCGLGVVYLSVWTLQYTRHNWHLVGGRYVLISPPSPEEVREATACAADAEHAEA